MNIMGFIGDVLARLHAAGFPEAIVAGGAIRDWDNNKADQIKDIDVFIQDRPTYLYDLNQALHGYTHRVMVPEHVAHYMDFEGVRMVHEYQAPSVLVGPEIIDDNGMNLSQFEAYPPVQIVVMGRPVLPESTIERHDFGICQIGYDGKRFFTTHHYDHDKMNKTFTLVRCRDGRDYARSLKRWARLSQKFGGWTLVANEVV